MPMRLPNAATIKRLIAEEAARRAGETPDHFLPMIGEIAPAGSMAAGRDCGWMLTSSSGTFHDHAMIHDAVSAVQRLWPLIRRDEETLTPE